MLRSTLHAPSMNLTQTLTSLDDHITLLTVNQRLAVFLRKEALQARQQAVLPGQWIQPLTAWIDQQWQHQLWQHTYPPHVLTAVQERVLWTEVIDQTDLDTDLLNKGALLQPIQRAWEVWYQRGHTWQDLAAIDTPNVHCFYRLAKAFAQRCQQHHAITRSEVLNHLDPQHLTAQTLYFAGFAEFTPQEQAFFTRCEQQGMALVTVTYPQKVTVTQRYSYADTEQQIQAVLTQAKALVAEGRSVGIVVPQLQQQRPAWLRLTSQIMPECAVQISGGEPLVAQYLIDQVWLHLAELSGQALPSQWAQKMLACLCEAGWPGQRTLTSNEYQVVQQFYGVLQHMGQLDAMMQTVSAKRAQALLMQLCQCTLFQAQSPDQPELMIMGLLESSGLIFDTLIVVDMDEQTFPSAPQHNPFLPRDARHWEMTLAKTLLQQWHGQCDTLHVTYVRQQEGVEQSISRLFPGEITHVPETPRVWQSAALTACDDQYGRALTSQDRATLKGGAGLIKAQALCPFQAYARYRWQLEALPEESLYLDAATRGTIVHEVVAACWTHGGGKADVEVITRVLQRWQNKAPQWFPPSVFLLERERLVSLMQAWFACEAEREAFTVVGHEMSLLVELANLPLQLRLDRVDELADGSRIVFDYKTRKHSVSSWLGPRPSEPQLPLYAVFAPSSGAAFALLRAGECGFQGVTDQEETLPDCHSVAVQRDMPFEHWEDLVAYWREVLTALAQQIQEGYAAVDPKSQTEACRYCDFKPVCRIR